jgi:hypothetical protein
VFVSRPCARKVFNGLLIKVGAMMEFPKVSVVANTAGAMLKPPLTSFVREEVGFHLQATAMKFTGLPFVTLGTRV